MKGRERGKSKGSRDVAQATINQDLDLIKSCIEVTRVAARRAAVHDKDGAPPDGEGLLPFYGTTTTD